jgi:hypothetical protein
VEAYRYVEYQHKGQGRLGGNLFEGQFGRDSSSTPALHSPTTRSAPTRPTQAALTYGGLTPSDPHWGGLPEPIQTARRAARPAGASCACARPRRFLPPAVPSASRQLAGIEINVGPPRRQGLARPKPEREHQTASTPADSGLGGVKPTEGRPPPSGRRAHPRADVQRPGAAGRVAQGSCSSKFARLSWAARSAAMGRIWGCCASVVDAQ